MNERTIQVYFDNSTSSISKQIRSGFNPSKVEAIMINDNAVDNTMICQTTFLGDNIFANTQEKTEWNISNTNVENNTHLFTLKKNDVVVNPSGNIVVVMKFE